MVKGVDNHAWEPSLSAICMFPMELWFFGNTVFGCFRRIRAPPSPQTPFLLLRGRADTLIGPQQRCWPACAPRSVPSCSYVLSDYRPSAAAYGGYAAADGRETLQGSTPTPSDHRICFPPETKAAPSCLAGRSKDGSGAVVALLPSFKSIIITSKTVCYTSDPME